MLNRTSFTTIERFILDQEHRYPQATGELSNLLYDIALAAKIIQAATRRAGLTNILGAVGNTNVQGEEQQKLDAFPNETLKNALNHTGRVCVMASEEDEGPIPIPEPYTPGKYVVLFDPLDGSSNIDVNAPVGTIFSIYPRASTSGAADIGECLLSHDQIKMQSTGKYYSVNESHFGRWSRGVQRAVRGFHGDFPERIKGKNSRYIGSLVADFHRNLIAGGIFMY